MFYEIFSFCFTSSSLYRRILICIVTALLFLSSINNKTKFFTDENKNRIIDSTSKSKNFLFHTDERENGLESLIRLVVSKNMFVVKLTKRKKEKKLLFHTGMGHWYLYLSLFSLNLKGTKTSLIRSVVVDSITSYTVVPLFRFKLMLCRITKYSLRLCDSSNYQTKSW